MTAITENSPSTNSQNENALSGDPTETATAGDGENAGNEGKSPTSAVSVEAVRQFLYREARFLDDREFETWLECYHPDVEFWMPAWDDDGELTTDPYNEISLIYYSNKGGLEDRVFRIRTDRSAATSMPEPRTGHNITNVEVLEQRGTEVDVRFNWFTLYYRYQTVDTYFGTSFYTIDVAGENPLITRKKVVLKNDCIHHVVDIYHI